jgi:hypothetical protein
MRFTVRSTAKSPQAWWFDTGNRTLQEVALFWLDADGRYENLDTGSTRKFGDRPLATTTFTFPITLQHGQTADIFLRVRSTGYVGIAAAPALWQAEGYRANEKHEHTFWVLMLGLAVALAAINLYPAFDAVAGRHQRGGHSWKSNGSIRLYCVRAAVDSGSLQRLFHIG